MTSLQHAAYVQDARGAFALYTSMRTAELLDLQSAFELDMAAASMPESIAFGAGRLALIAAALRTRTDLPRGTSQTSVSDIEKSQT